VSCIIGAFKSQYHWTQGEYVHRYGIKDCGTMALLAGAGPMGLGAIDYTLHGPRQPRLLVVTDIDQDRLDRAASLFPPEEAAERDVELKFVNTSGDDPVETLKALNAGEGYDDVFVFAPVAPVVEQGDAILGYNGCLNFFAGPSDPGFSAKINFYDIHYSGHHIAGSSGGNTEDLKEAIDLMANDKINPAVMITHVGGMDHAAETVYNLPKIPGGKKLIYTQISMPLVALTELRDKAREIPYLEGLAGIVEKNNGLWSIEAEEYLLEHAEPLAAG
jgi:threonine dehydrogenase-like Zn-dependent dehydrogenase